MPLFSAMSGWTAWNYITALADIAILAFVIYELLLLIRGTRAVQLVRGLLVLLAVFLVSDFIGLHAVNWILEQVWTVIFLALVIIFQPELRRALERIGRGSSLLTRSASLTAGDIAHVIDEIVGAEASRRGRGVQLLGDLVRKPHHGDSGRAGEAHRLERLRQIGRQLRLGGVGVADLVVADLDVDGHPRLAVVAQLHVERLHHVGGRDAARRGGLDGDDPSREAAPARLEPFLQIGEVPALADGAGRVHVARVARDAAAVAEE